MLRVLTLCALLAITGAAAAQAADKPNFDYDASQPAPPATVDAATHMLAERFADGRTISGELIPGQGAGPHPAVLFVHWLGDPPTTNHTEFEADAGALAKLGVTSLLVEAPWSKTDAWFDPLGASADADIKSSEAEVVDLRRALTLLLSQPGVDRHRVAYVGHDFGAMFGLMLASVDRRPSYFVFMTPNSSLSGWYLIGKKPPEGYVARLAGFDLPAFASRLKAKSVLFQFSTHDIYVTHERAQAVFDAAPQPKTIEWIDADHSLVGDGSSYKSRMAWLEHALGVAR